EFLGVEEFDPTSGAPLRDHAGRPWMGNSSYGDKPAIDRDSTGSWRNVLSIRDQRFIAACTRWEMERAEYQSPPDLDEEDIAGYEEDERAVRAAYLAGHRLDATS